MQPADDIGLAVCGGETFVKLFAVIEVVYQHEGTGGIGAGIANVLAEKGWRVTASGDACVRENRTTCLRRRRSSGTPANVSGWARVEASHWR